MGDSGGKFSVGVIEVSEHVPLVAVHLALHAADHGGAVARVAEIKFKYLVMNSGGTGQC